MKNLTLGPFMLILIACFVYSCNPENNDRSGPCNLDRITDSANLADYEVFEFDANNRQVKYRATMGGGSPNLGYTDTFVYSSNLLAKTHYNLGQTIQPTPYAKTEYEYSGSLLTGSRYFLGHTNLITHSQFSFNGTRISNVTQFADNPGMGGRAHSTRFEYDAQGNLSRIWLREGAYPEYMVKEYSDYDDKPNPFCKTPWNFDFDIYLYNDHKISTNNARRLKIFSSFAGSTPVLTDDVKITLSYDGDGKVTKRSFNNNGNYAGAELFTYKCQ